MHWRGDRWELRDLGSRNGTFVAGRRLATGERVVLAQGAAFSLSRSSAVFKLGDASAPPTAARNEATGTWHPAVGGLLALPPTQEPLVTIFATAEGQWMIESDEGTRAAVDGERLSVGGDIYKLEVTALGVETLPSVVMSALLDSVRLRLAVAPDEEDVEATVFIGGQPCRLPKRRYHYLLTTLARAWLAESSVPASVRGYVDRDDLCKKLQMDVNKLNVEIFRARKQFAALGVAGAAGLVERRPGTRELRIGIRDVEVVRL